MFIYVYISEELLQITYKGSSARLQNERRKSVFSAVVFCSRGEIFFKIFDLSKKAIQNTSDPVRSLLSLISLVFVSLGASTRHIQFLGR